jgi:hypothetical protein
MRNIFYCSLVQDKRKPEGVNDFPPILLKIKNQRQWVGMRGLAVHKTVTAQLCCAHGTSSCFCLETRTRDVEIQVE